MSDMPYPAALPERIASVEANQRALQRRVSQLEEVNPAVLSERIRAMEKRLDRLIAGIYAVAGILVALLGVVLGRGL